MIVALDYDTHGADIVGLDNEADTATWRHITFTGADALARARSVRDAMPARGAWLDAGAILIVVERPMSRSPHGLVPLMRTLGTIHACLPAGIDVWELAAVEWRRELGMKVNAKRADAKAEARDFAAARWADLPSVVTQDGMDAFCMAYAARQMCEKAAAA